MPLFGKKKKDSINFLPPMDDELKNILKGAGIDPAAHDELLLKSINLDLKFNSTVLKCKKCGSLFEAFCDTYHGGGSFKRIL